MGGDGVFLNTKLENKVFSHENLKNSLFCILCIQVLGHIPSSSLNHVIGVFHRLLEPRGTLIIAIPIVNNEFNFPKWDKRDDFFHLVNLALGPKHSEFRIALDKNKFDYITEHPQKNLLPVRSFFLKEKIEIGHVCLKDRVESTSIGRVLKKYKFIIKNAEIYSKHERGVGDLMMKIIHLH